MITHGFTVDGEGKKISKSLGNDVDTQKLIATYGAEVLRLWTIMVDYREDMRISDDMIKRVAEAYRKVRNTIRYLLSNLNDFDPARDGVPEAALDELDRYALDRHRQVVARVLDAYESYEFHLVYHQLVQYAAADLSSFYLDVLKDRLYCDAAAGPRRRSAQTVLHRMARDLCLLLAPVLPFTADEAWPSVPGNPEPSVHLALFPAREADGRRARRPLGAAPRRPRRGHEGARGGAGREAGGGQPRGRGRPARARRVPSLPCARTRRGATSSPGTWPTSSS